MESMWKSVESMWKMCGIHVKKYGIYVEKCGIHVVVMEQNHSIWIPLECGGRVKYWKIGRWGWVSALGGQVNRKKINNR